LSTRPVRQELAEIPIDPAAHERRRRQVVAGAYTLRPCAHPVVTIVAVGGIVTEAIEARDRLTGIGINVEVVCVTSPSLLFEAVRSRQGLCDAPTWILDQVFPADRAAPMVTVIDDEDDLPESLERFKRINAAYFGRNPIQTDAAKARPRRGSRRVRAAAHTLRSDPRPRGARPSAHQVGCANIRTGRRQQAAAMPLQSQEDNSFPTTN
jgi:hypothetical protein